MLRRICLAFAITCCAMPAWANARLTLLMDALAIPEIVQILQNEGAQYSEILNQDMLDGQGGAFWQEQVTRIYDAQRINEQIRTSLEDGLTEAELEGVLAFFSTAGAVRVVALENAARRAMADPAIEDAARAIYRENALENGGLLLQVERYIDENDLLERNVTGAMSANFQFYKGLSDGDLIPRAEAEILREVWSQQDDIRADTDEWLKGFLMMAYQPLSESELAAYVDFSASADGQALNAALFAGFDGVSRDISYALGRAVALIAAADEI